MSLLCDYLQKKDGLSLLLALPRNNGVDVVSSVSFGVLPCRGFPLPLTIPTSVPISHGVTVRSALHWLEDTNVDVFQNRPQFSAKFLERCLRKHSESFPSELLLFWVAEQKLLDSWVLFFTCLKKKWLESNKFVHCYKVIEIDLKVMMVKVMYTLTLHRLLWNILKFVYPEKPRHFRKRASGCFSDIWP